MAREFHDGIAQAVTVTGTGNATLAASTTYPARITLQSKVSAGAVVPYRIAAVDANDKETGEWETGRGTYLGSNAFQRTTPDAGSGPLPVNFTAGTTKKFTLVPTAVDMRILGGLTGGWSLTYDSNGQLATATINGAVYTPTITTVAGKKRMTSITGGGSTVNLTYDSNGRLVSPS